VFASSFSAKSSLGYSVGWSRKCRRETTRGNRHRWYWRLGSLAVQFAKALGYFVVTIDNREEGRALAVEAELKADLVVDYNEKDATKKITEVVGKGGLAAVLCTTDAQDAITWSPSALRTKGTLVEIGLPLSISNLTRSI
jgi:D-arabinose 1-dehydrogenase-like Zn-dependent alcohol dehydrogenase